MEHRKDEQEFEESSPRMELDEAEMAETEAAGAVEENDDSEEAAQIPMEESADSEEAAPTPAEQFADSARTQAGAAAGALRRGEFMHDSAVDPSADHDDRLIALLCYVTQVLIPLVMPAIVLLSASSKKRPFQRFHAVQSLALSMTFILFMLLMFVGSTIVALVPIVGWLAGVAVLTCVVPLLALMGFLALAYYGYQAYQGKRFTIPGLTSFLQDQNWI